MKKLKSDNLNGVLLLNKPVGITSQTAVFKVKKIFGAKKVGHLGTLDPLACGVLPITLGKSTRLFEYFLNKTKTYKAVFAFGFETETLDCEGKILNVVKKDISIKEIENILNKFIGEIEQLPPKFSAKNINGQKAYKLARIGKDFELKPKKIKIFDIKVEKTSENLKNTALNNFKLFNKD
ncbi:MAG: tRNA pseudouridine(55) synthase TruB, partial [Clostridia bacterium]|nr:tRNA pseudouridine(55) synthase TruB [Clostridia bacterium]